MMSHVFQLARPLIRLFLGSVMCVYCIYIYMDVCVYIQVSICWQGLNEVSLVVPWV